MTSVAAARAPTSSPSASAHSIMTNRCAWIPRLHLLKRFLNPPAADSSQPRAVVAIGAFAVHFIAGVFEFLSTRREQIQFGSGTLRQDRVTRVAIVRFDRLLLVES